MRHLGIAKKTKEKRFRNLVYVIKEFKELLVFDGRRATVAVADIVAVTVAVATTV
jgi:hypothetical protein